ncbi:MAG: alpha-ketoacid dehydrogenase subunit beta, partial [Luteibaculum sp.]
SISSEIAYRVQRDAFDFLDAPVKRVTLEDTPFAFAIPLINQASPNAEKAIRMVKEVMYIEK